MAHTNSSTHHLESAFEGVDIDTLVHHDDVIANGVRLHYVEAGPEDGDLVVLLHGFPEFWYSWRYQIPALAEAGYRVVAPDMRGYNRSEKPHGTAAYHIDELTGDVRSLVHALGESQAHIVGHDWGGGVAWATGYSHPEVVDTLTIMNAPHPEKFVRELSLEQLARSWYMLCFQLPWLPEQLFSARDFASFESVFQDGAESPEAFSDDDVERYKAAFRRPGALTSAINYYRALARNQSPRAVLDNVPLIGDRLAPSVPEVTAPTLVLWGENDTALSLEQAHGLERYVDDVRVQQFSNAGHWVNADRPDAVNEALLEFLEAEH